MFAQFRIRRRLVWLAALAVLFAALAPAVAQAMNAKRGVDAGLTPICTHAGLKWVDVATGEVRDPPGDTGVSGHLERCPFCLSQLPAVPLAGRPFVAKASLLDHEQPFLFDHAPRPLFIWTSAQSRAPPAHA